MLIVYAIVMTGVAFWFWLKYTEAYATFMDVRDDNAKLLEQNKFIKESVEALFKRPAYVVLTDPQIAQMSAGISSELKGKQWVN